MAIMKKQIKRNLSALLMLISIASGCHAAIVEVVSGDKVRIDGQLAHLADIDVPDICQPGGAEARKAMNIMLRGDLSYEAVRLGREGLPEIRLYVNGREINQLLVQSGWAKDITQSSPSRYAFAESVAKMDGLGIWAVGYRGDEKAGSVTCS